MGKRKGVFINAEEQCVKRQATTATIIANIETTRSESSSWKHALETSKSAFGNARYNDAISHSSLALHDLRNNVFCALAIRSVAYGNAGHFKEAMQDAQEMIHQAPTNVTGYMHAGDLHAQYGQQEAAIRIYDKGLTALSSEDPKRSLLEIRKSEAQVRQAQRVDFITQLPCDILLNVLEELFTIDILLMTTVSKSCLTHITLAMTQDDLIPPVGTILRVCKNLSGFTLMSESIQPLDLSEMPPNYQSQKLIRLELYGTFSIPNATLKRVARAFPKLRFLGATNCEPNAIDIINDTTLFHLLEYINISTTQHYSRRSYDITDVLYQLNDKLSSCSATKGRGLSKIELTEFHHGKHILTLLNKNKYTLKSLTLQHHSEASYLVEGQGIAIFESSFLQELIWKNNQEMNLELERMLLCCPSLKEIDITITDGTISEQVYLALKKLSYLEKLTMVATHVDYYACKDDNMVKLFEEHANRAQGHSISLSHVDLRCDELKDDVLISLAKIKTLKEVSLWYCAGITEDGLIQFFTECPDGLTTICLVGIAGGIVTEAVLRIINSMGSMRRLVVEGFTDEKLKEVITNKDIDIEIPGL
ncbi:hypothetical protein BDA99DRAFT_533219 [Phascolomyces articulosus]|uniref:F-box domain-containing protein n=1 Tax=Phascolomyces articulosus TaxID=60185 RepID=A0AAD5KLB1_9FUNG|nr:hypothetical protein BDA99DRAFT_533219 [Phascolomyces articulosus]